MNSPRNTAGNDPIPPRHVAIVMDGNRRWAQERALPQVDGHRAGVNNLHRVLQTLGDYGVKHVTIFAFSTENWKRSEQEVKGLITLFEEIITPKSRELNGRGVQIRHLGSLKGVSAVIRRSIQGAVRLTRGNRDMILNVAFNYGSRWEMVDAVRRIVKQGTAPGEIDEALLEDHLYTRGQPDVDLMIRTGGERRLSNFMLWQSAYAEIYFSDRLWPDFDEAEVARAVTWYGQRQRRFGG